MNEQRGATIDLAARSLLPQQGSRRAIFVDRDGVVNVNQSDHVKSWSEFRFLPGALEGLALLAEHGHTVFVITNQAIVGRSVVSRDELDSIHDRMIASIVGHGGKIADVFVCAHRPDEGCGCRKPAPGMLIDAATRHDIDLARAVLIGDHVTDLEAARRAGCPSLLVLSGRTASWPHADLPVGCLGVVPDLLAAAQLVVADSGMLPSALSEDARAVADPREAVAVTV